MRSLLFSIGLVLSLSAQQCFAQHYCGNLPRNSAAYFACENLNQQEERAKQEETERRLERFRRDDVERERRSEQLRRDEVESERRYREKLSGGQQKQEESLSETDIAILQTLAAGMEKVMRDYESYAGKDAKQCLEGKLKRPFDAGGIHDTIQAAFRSSNSKLREQATTFSGVVVFLEAISYKCIGDEKGFTAYLDRAKRRGTFTEKLAGIKLERDTQGRIANIGGLNAETSTSALAKTSKEEIQPTPNWIRVGTDGISADYTDRNSIRKDASGLVHLVMKQTYSEPQTSEDGFIFSERRAGLALDCKNSTLALTGLGLFKEQNKIVHIYGMNDDFEPAKWVFRKPTSDEGALNAILKAHCKMLADK